MKLLVDFGNTRTKAVLSDNGELTQADFSLELFQQFDIEKLCYASVRHEQESAALVAKAKSVGAEVRQVTTSSEAFGVKCAYDNYQTLGIDRWLAVLGAVATFPNEDIVVVDAGTATTVDFVTRDNLHLGGWIIPGLELMTSSVTERTDKVFDDMDIDYRYDVGKATPQALKFGCLAAQLGIVQQAMSYFRPGAKLAILGGTAPLMLPSLAQFHPYHEPLLVFKGMDLY